MNDEDLLAGFESQSLPNDAFHHQEHVRVAWMFVKRDGVARAMATFSESLKRFAVAKGKPNLYHETITFAYLLLIGERLARKRAATWNEFAAENADLLTWKPGVLDRYYSDALLWSDLARATFVMPDRITGSAMA
jgi:hypothetical protein